MNALILYRINGDKRMYRFYRLDVQPDLFGQWCLMREWGPTGRLGRTHSVVAEAALDKERQAKERRDMCINSDWCTSCQADVLRQRFATSEANVYGRPHHVAKLTRYETVKAVRAR